MWSLRAMLFVQWRSARPCLMQSMRCWPFHWWFLRIADSNRLDSRNWPMFACLVQLWLWQIMQPPSEHHSWHTRYPLRRDLQPDRLQKDEYMISVREVKSWFPWIYLQIIIMVFRVCVIDNRLPPISQSEILPQIKLVAMYAIHGIAVYSPFASTSTCITLL